MICSYITAHAYLEQIDVSVTRLDCQLNAGSCWASFLLFQLLKSPRHQPTCKPNLVVLEWAGLGILEVPGVGGAGYFEVVVLHGVGGAG